MNEPIPKGGIILGKGQVHVGQVVQLNDKRLFLVIGLAQRVDITIPIGIPVLYVDSEYVVALNGVRFRFGMDKAEEKIKLLEKQVEDLSKKVAELQPKGL